MFAHDDDVFERIAAEERKAEFFGSSEEIWDQQEALHDQTQSDNEAAFKRSAVKTKANNNGVP